MDIFMLVKDVVENVRSSFAMEGMIMSKEDEKRGIGLLNGEINIEDVITDIKSKYVPIRSNT